MRIIPRSVVLPISLLIQGNLSWSGLGWIALSLPPNIPIHQNILDHSSSLHSMPPLACACFFISFGTFPAVNVTGPPVEESRMFRVSGLTFLFLFTGANFLAQCSADQIRSRGFCDTAPPTESLKNEYRRLSTMETGPESDNVESLGRLAAIEIDTYFHIVSSHNDGERVSDEMIKDQVQISPFLISSPACPSPGDR